jgi:type IV secretory pathway TraG/TraD family ATPase VirD4
MNSMETQIFTRQSDLGSSAYVTRRLGQKSEYAHGSSTHDDDTTESESEQAVALLTPQEVAELSETEILCLHRNLKPIRGHRMDWREYKDLKTLAHIQAPQLPALAPVPRILPLASSHPPEPVRIHVPDLKAMRRQQHSTFAMGQNPQKLQKTIRK